MIPVRALATLTARARAFLLERGARTTTPAFDVVRPILDAVRRRGDAAIREFTRTFDRVDRRSARVTPEEWRTGAAALAPKVRAALKRAAAQIESFHARQIPRDIRVPNPHGCAGSVLGRRPVALDRIGVYVPGGSAAYPSTVLMGAIPARLAGVGEIVLVSPPGRDGRLPPAVLAAAQIAGVDAVYAVGGAQAVAALAYGTRSIPAVDKIVGPGNAFVTAAKMLVRERVAIDLPAGPSEILIVSDGTGDPRFLAADMISQAEHSPDASAVLITTSARQARAVAAALHDQIADLPRAEILRKALRDCGAILIARTLKEAVDFANAYAAEHLTLATARPESTLRAIRHAGSIFLGAHAPVAIGDYCSGTNHVLPTAGAARMYSGLSVLDFLRFQTWQKFSPAGLARIAPTAVTIARAEGLEAHARALELRTGVRS